MANTRKGSARRGRNARKPSAIANKKGETKVGNGSQEQQKNVSPPESRRVWQGRLRAQGQQQSSTHASSTEKNLSVSSSTTTPHPKSKSVSKIDDNKPNTEDGASKNKKLVSYSVPMEEESDDDSDENTESVEADKGPPSILKRTFYRPPPPVITCGLNFAQGGFPDELEADAQQLLTCLYRCFRCKKDPESNHFVVALLHAAIYTAESGAKSAIFFDISEEELSAEIATCRKQKIKDANKAIAKLPRIRDKKENCKCRFVEEAEVNIYTPHKFEVKDRMLRKLEIFLDGKTAGDLSKTKLEFKHKGLISAENPRTYVAKAEMMQNHIEKQKPSVPLFSAASVHLRQMSSEVDVPALIRGLSRIQRPAAASSSSGSRPRLTQSPSLAGSKRVREIKGAEKRKHERSGKRKSQREEEEEEEVEAILEVPSKRPRLKEKIVDADQSRGADNGVNNTQTLAKEGSVDADAFSFSAKEDTPPRPSKARIVEQSPEHPARPSRAQMRDGAAAMKAQKPQVEDSEPQPWRRLARSRARVPKSA